MSSCFGRSSPKTGSEASSTERSLSPPTRVPSPTSSVGSPPKASAVSSPPEAPSEAARGGGVSSSSSPESATLPLASVSAVPVTPAGSAAAKEAQVLVRGQAAALPVTLAGASAVSEAEIQLRDALVQVQIGAAKARLYDEMRAERDQLRMRLEEARTQQQVLQEEAARLRAVAAQTEELRAENARLVAQIHAQAAAAESTQAELEVVKRAREAAAGAAQAALDASAAAQEASRQCQDVQHAQSVAHDALLHDMDTIEAELSRVTAQLEASQQARESMAEEIADLRARCALQRRELEDARAALNEYDAGEDALDAALEAAARRLGATPKDDATVTSQASSRTAAIRRRTLSALQALRRAHAAEQSASLARERLVAEEDIVSQLKAELEEARLRAQCVQQPTQTLVQNLTDARQQAAQWRSAADTAARDLMAMRDDFRLALDSRQKLDASLAKALTKIASSTSASGWVRPGRRTVPPARR